MNTPPVNALMVEDDIVAQKAAQHLLSRLNCQLDVVAMATKGLEKVIVSNYDIIFIDIQLPDINGLEFVQIVRMGEPKGIHIPIIAVTSTPSDELRTKAKNIGCDDFMAKPLTVESLQIILEKHLDKTKQNSINRGAGL